MPPAFNLSQDQTLQFISLQPPTGGQSSLDGISTHAKMLADVSGVSLDTTKHPHKLSQQTVKDLLSTTPQQRQDRPFYRYNRKCQATATTTAGGVGASDTLSLESRCPDDRVHDLL